MTSTLPLSFSKWWDARWTVPEPELVLASNRDRRIVGYTLRNDVSSRDIEGEKPLYLPQAKIYDNSCAIGPAIWIDDQPPDLGTEISFVVERGGECAFQGRTTLARIRRALRLWPTFIANAEPTNFPPEPSFREVEPGVTITPIWTGDYEAADPSADKPSDSAEEDENDTDMPPDFDSVIEIGADADETFPA